MGNTIKEKQVLDSHASKSMGTEVAEQFLGKTTGSKRTNRATDNRGERECKESLDQEDPKQYLSKFASIWLGAGKREHKHPGPVVQSLNSAMHLINPYPLDSSVVFDITYPVDSDLSTQ